MTTSASRKPGRPTRAQIEELNRTLLDAAERLFMAQGFEATSIEQLAEAAGVNKRTIYHRFPTKETMFEAVVIRSTDRILHDGHWAQEGSTVEDRLTTRCLSIIDRALAPEQLALLRVTIAESPRFPALAERVDAHGRARAISYLSETLAREVERGELVLTDCSAAAEQLLGLTCLVSLLRALMGRDAAVLRAEAATSVRSSVRLFLDGCRRTATPGTRPGT